MFENRGFLLANLNHGPVAREGPRVSFIRRRTGQNKVIVAVHKNADHTGKWYTTLLSSLRVLRRKESVRQACSIPRFGVRLVKIRRRMSESFQFAAQFEPVR